MPKRLASGERALTEAAARERFPSTGMLTMALEGMLAPEHSLVRTARGTCRELRVLHWPLAFPQVFEQGGFDVVLGNPPWERIKLQEQEFFASRAPEVAQARNKAARDRAIAALERAPEDSPERALFEEFTDAKQQAEAASVFCHAEARYPLTGVGDVNTYALFAETAYRVVARFGRTGLVLPIGIATDDTTKRFFGALVSSNQLAMLLGCHEIRGWFPDTDDSRPFCLLVVGCAPATDLAFQMASAADFRDKRRWFRLNAPDFALINPNTRTCPTFRSGQDAAATKKIYQHVSVLIEEGKPDRDGNPWGLSFMAMFHMANDSSLFRDEPSSGSLSLYESKMIHQFDHRWATYEPSLDARGVPSSRELTVAEKADPWFSVRPRYWVLREEVARATSRVPKLLRDAYYAGDEQLTQQHLRTWFAGYHFNRGEDEEGERLLSQSVEPAPRRRDGIADPVQARAQEEEYPLSLSDVVPLPSSVDALRIAHELIERKVPDWFIGWRDVTKPANERTLLVSVIPQAAVNHKAPLFKLGSHVDARHAACLLASLNALVTDFVTRQKMGGMSLGIFILKQLPVPSPQSYSPADIEFIVPRVLELTYTAHDLTPWARDLGYTGEPFRWNPERRAVLRAELDAYYARLYGLTRDELRYVLDPADVMGPDYPSETFRVLKNNEEREFGEYRTRRLVLEAWDALASGQMVASQLGAMVEALQAPLPVKPVLAPAEAAVLSVLALVRASGGSLKPSVLVRSYGLRNHPQRVVQNAPVPLQAAARAWAERTADGSGPSLIPVLQRLADGGALVWQVDGDSERISTTPSTPEESRLSPWFQYEARLLLVVADAMPESQIATVDAQLPEEDRTLLRAIRA